MKGQKKKNVRIAQIYTDFTLPLVQSSAKPGKGMPGSGGQEWPGKLATKLNGATLTIRVSDCSLDLLQNDSSQSRDGSKEPAILKKRSPFDSI